MVDNIPIINVIIYRLLYIYVIIILLYNSNIIQYSVCSKLKKKNDLSLALIFI